MTLDYVLLGLLSVGTAVAALLTVPALWREHRRQRENERRARAIEDALSKPVEEDEP